MPTLLLCFLFLLENVLTKVYSEICAFAFRLKCTYILQLNFNANIVITADNINLKENIDLKLKTFMMEQRYFYNHILCALSA